MGAGLMLLVALAVVVLGVNAAAGVVVLVRWRARAAGERAAVRQAAEMAQAFRVARMGWEVDMRGAQARRAGALFAQAGLYERAGMPREAREAGLWGWMALGVDPHLDARGACDCAECRAN